MYENLEEFPSKDPFKRFLDRFIFVVGLLGPVMTIPQLVNVWVLRETAGVSAISWASYAVFNLVWVTYGIVHREKPIIFTYVLWFFVNAAVALGTVVNAR